MIGRTLSHYEILDKLGSGGMGIVYRARDTKLGRSVAIKVLSEDFTRDPQRLARFEREARLLASLNHPNIATLHGLEESGDVHFLVMELVPGETLAERIGRGAIPADEALPLFIQIAEALQAAHETAVIHRDLKPANIKITPENKVKVLDFGLAKAFGGEPGVPDSSQSPTMTRDATQAGIILGTAAYMSPEQARGKSVDKRTDIWAFGCCLYEALTGGKAFGGDTVTDIFARILEREPEWQALPTTIPALLRSLLRRCLEKDPQRRVHDIADARIEIEESLTEPPTSLGPAVPSPKKRLVPFMATALVAALATGVVVWSLMRPAPTAPLSLKRFAIHLPQGDELDLDWGWLDISPDGKNLVYVARRGGAPPRLYLRPLDQLEAVPLPGTEEARSPFFSPDGEWIGFHSGGMLKKVSVSGGAPLSLCDVERLWGTSWGTDDTIYFSTASEELFRVSSSGGTPERVMTLVPEPEEHPSYWLGPALPGGKAVFVRAQSSTGDIHLAVASLETGEQRILVENCGNSRYVPTGHIVFQRSGSLMAVPFDLERLEIVGSPVPVFEDVQLASLGGVGHFGVSREGSLIYVAGSTVSPDLTLVWVDRKGVEQPLAETLRPYRHPRLSPDGQRMVIRVDPRAVHADVWVLELARGTLTRLTFEGINGYPLWTRDGERIIFSSTRAGGFTSIFSRSADGTGTAEQLTTGASRRPTSVSSDGKTILFLQSGDTTGFDIGMVRLEGKRESEILMGTPFDEHTGMLSPDDQWLAYVSNESGREEVYVRSFPGPAGRVQVSAEGGAEPMWSRDGSEIFYRNGEKVMAVAISTEPDLAPGKPNLLFEGRFQSGVTVDQFTSSNYDVAPDGRFVMIRTEHSSAPTQIHIVLNWLDELKRLVPTN